MTTGHIRILTISIACVLCTCLADSAAAQPQAPRPTYYFCLSHPTPDTAYFSFVIDYSLDGDARAWNAAGERELRSGGRAPNPGPAPWVVQFDQFVAQTYPRTAKGAGSCSNFGTLAEAQKRLDEVIQSEQNSKYKVFKTGWKYTPNPNATPPTPASQPVAAAPVAAAQPVGDVVASQSQTPYMVCWAQSSGPPYVSAAGDGTKGDKRAWTVGFFEFLNKKYGFSGATHCEACALRQKRRAI